MNDKLFLLSKRALAGVIALALVAGPVTARTPNDVSDLVYQDYGWGAEQLRKRGYTEINSDYHNGKTVEYWWSGASNTCLKAHADDNAGKYESISTTSSTDCNQYHKEASEGNTAAAIALGAAALIGAAVLAHQSHQRDDKHGEDSKSVAEFDRGYRDGLHHERYHNYNDTTAYSDGYNAGQRERDEETRHRARDGHHSGYHSYVSLDDLVGAKASSADSAMRSRGFSDTGGYKQGNKSIVTWYNGGTRQCVKSVTKDGRIKRIESIAEGNCL